jgi:hypothetical protein
MTATGGQPNLSAFQQEVARMFFARRLVRAELRAFYAAWRSELAS